MAKSTDTGTGTYAEETLTFSTPGKKQHVDVTLNLTYSTQQTKAAAKAGYYEVVAGTGTYDVIGKDGTVLHSYPITQVLTKGHVGGNDNRIYIGGKNAHDVVNGRGISFEISKPTAHAPNATLKYNFFHSSNNSNFELYTPYQNTNVVTSSIKAVSGGSRATVEEDAALVAVCFTSGTRIRTARGEVAVETLAVGDLVVTASGTLRPVRWLGHRTIDCRRHPRPALVLPVRIAAHAFGAGLPARDLLVSPGHAICVDVAGEALVPAIALVNGATIAQREVDHVTYWHVELDAHDIVLAECLPAESYLEMGNRGFFAESGAVALAATPDAATRTHADFCRPFHGEGPLVDAVRARLAARAAYILAGEEDVRAA